MIAESQALPYGLPYGLPARPSIPFGTYIQVPYMKLTELQYSIKQALIGCESITLFEWDPDDFSYIIEYASRPIEETISPDLLYIIHAKKLAVHLAATDAINRFPHNHIIDFNDLPPLLEFPRRWSKTKVSIFWDEQHNCLCIESYRFKGDRSSSLDVRSLIRQHFDQMFQIQTDLKNALVEAGVDIENTNLREYLVCDLVPQWL